MSINSSVTLRDIAEALVINRYYGMQLHPGLFGKHKTISEEGSIEANRKLLADLRLLLDVLKGPTRDDAEQELADIIGMVDASPLGGQRERS